MQLLTILFGVFLRGFATPTELERKAQIYTSTNKKNQTYSLIYHRSDYPLSYLDYHMKMVEENRDMINGSCKIFFTNGVDFEKNRSPFAVSLNETVRVSPIVFLSNTNLSLEDYFDLKMNYGNGAIGENEIIVSSSYSDKIAKIFKISEISELIGREITNSTDNHVYTIKGIFDMNGSLLSNYYLDDLVIGHFNNFSKIAVNPRVGFVTSKLYLENLFFLYRISVFIDPPSYGRTTIVSTSGNDFDGGGNKDLTNKIYNLQVGEANMVFVSITWFFAISSFLCIICFAVKGFNNKKCIRIVAVTSVLLGCVASLVSYFINNYVLSNPYTPYLGMLSGLFTFTFLIIFIVLCFVLDSYVFRRKHHIIATDNNYYIINI